MQKTINRLLLRPMQMQNSDIIEVLGQFESINLQQMDAVKLMNRTDTKFVFSRRLLKDVLSALTADYNILEINHNIISSYKTLYFDTKGFNLFLDHHNGKGNRYKVRIRQYVESNLHFLEIKNKVKGRTEKVRVRIEGFENILSDKSKKFITDTIGEEINLEAKLWNEFQRVTLVNTKAKERVTLDLGVRFSNEETKVSYDGIVIAELKQEDQNRSSAFYSVMKKNLIRPNSISKYCVGAVGIYPKLKYNNFKSKLILIENLD